MPAAVPIILAVSTAVAASAATYQAVDANQQRQHAKGAAQAQADQAKAMQDELLKQQKEQEASAQAERDANATREADQAATDEGNASRDQSRRRQQALRAGAGSRQSTILTSPLGDTGAATTATKTLLGA